MSLRMSKGKVLKFLYIIWMVLVLFFYARNYILPKAFEAFMR